MRYVAPSKDEMDAIPPERAEYHNISTPWWSEGGTSQGICRLWTMRVCPRDMAEK